MSHLNALSRRRLSLACLLFTGTFSMLVFTLLYRPQLSSEESIVKEDTLKRDSSLQNVDEPEEAFTYQGYPLRQPDVAWIMSFGGSGTSYTILNVEQLTGMTTASNYGGDYDPCIPLRPEWTQGPFVRSPQKPYPEHFILTKTHCGGYCMDCAPSQLSPDAFEQACCTGKRGDNQSVTYNREIPRKAIHLIRDPFGNLVGRMHLFNKHHRDRTSFPTTQEGVAAWCRYLDTKYPVVDDTAATATTTTTTSSSFLEAYRHVPCHAEWFRYVQWHNLAWETTQQRLQIPVYYLHYDNYESQYNATVKDILEFLQARPRSDADPLPFYAGKSYHSLFGSEHVQSAARMTKEMAVPEVWELLEPYFPQVEDGTVGFDSSDDDDTHVDTNSGTKSGSPQVAWLLSFPNSGTSYTITNTEHMSMASTASNYAGDWKECVGVRPDLNETGPFLHRPDLPVPPFVLTKTHCTGYCDDCAPSRYIIKDSKIFEDGCLTGTKNESGVSTSITYDPEVPVKAVHLIRSPFDNIVSRIHLGIKRRRRRGWNETELAKFSGKEGFHTWCKSIDEKFADAEQSTSLLHDNIKELLRGVPCHADMVRYVQWHNLAIEMLQRRALPVHVLHYENYSTAYNATVDALFEFLGLEKKAKPLEFVTGKTYSVYYSEDETRGARKLVQAVASPETWELVKHYFDPWESTD